MTAVAFLGITGCILAGCGKKTEAETAAAQQPTTSEEKETETASPENGEERVVRVATGGNYFPYTFMENDQLVGVDIDIWNEIGKRSGFTVEWEIADMEGMFGMLDAGKVDSAARQITITEKRKEKYDFSEVYAYNPYKIVVAETDNSINSAEDLYGKKVSYNPVSASGAFLDEFDKENKIERVLYSAGGDTLKEVELGRIDACFNAVNNFEAKKEKGGYKIKQVGDPVYYEQNAYPFLKSADNDELLEMVNKALREMREDGTLSEISLKWVGKDVSVENN